MLWTRANTAEAAPGVLTALGWSFYGELTEINIRRGFADLGVIPAHATSYPPAVEDRFLGVFSGRLSINVGVFRRLMMGLPGVSGDDIERDILGSVRPGVVDEPYPGRTRAVLTRAPLTLARNSARTTAFRRDIHQWWSAGIDRNGARIDPRRLLDEAVEQWGHAIRLQGTTRMIYQGATSQLVALACRAGDPGLAERVLSGTGGVEETHVADDLWRTAVGELSLEAFLARHGFHGPNVGDIATRTWREDPTPIERLLPRVREAGDPRARRAGLASTRDEATRALLSGLPVQLRPLARLLTRLAPASAVTLERTKASFLIALDGARAATRTLGDELVSAGTFAHRDDGFHLLLEELRAVRPGDTAVAELIARRRAQHAAHREITLPTTWSGRPEPVVDAGDDAAETRVVTGIGGSPGVVEGVVRVVLDSDDADVDVDDVLVCPVTDPSWVSVMTVAAALVIDIGGSSSHGAIVARELGVPCVIGTRNGTRVLRTGDRVRVDGGAGTVEILARAPQLTSDQFDTETAKEVRP